MTTCRRALSQSTQNSAEATRCQPRVISLHFIGAVAMSVHPVCLNAGTQPHVGVTLAEPGRLASMELGISVEFTACAECVKKAEALTAAELMLGKSVKE
jgi:hypothetical protein